MQNPQDLKPGEGDVMYVNGEDLAVFNDNGTIRAASAICTHQTCIIGWNAEGKTFDCPCHGSKFDTHFNPLNGPAKQPLEPRDLTE